MLFLKFTRYLLFSQQHRKLYESVCCQGKIFRFKEAIVSWCNFKNWFNPSWRGVIFSLNKSGSICHGFKYSPFSAVSPCMPVFRKNNFLVCSQLRKCNLYCQNASGPAFLVICFIDISGFNETARITLKIRDDNLMILSDLNSWKTIKTSGLYQTLRLWLCVGIKDGSQFGCAT